MLSPSDLALNQAPKALKHLNNFSITETTKQKIAVLMRFFALSTSMGLEKLQDFAARSLEEGDRHAQMI